jgi:hypothetical protein
MTQMPPKFHTAVNCGRSNRLIEVTATSDAIEPWSYPWHALQRTLAKAFGTDVAMYPEVRARSDIGARLPDVGPRAAEAVSWLVRARSTAASAAVLSTPR